MVAPDRATLAGPTLGTVDLVAVDRVRHGIPAELTPEDWAYLVANLTGGNEESRLIGQALGYDDSYIQKIYGKRKRALPPP